MGGQLCPDNPDTVRQAIRTTGRTTPYLRGGRCPEPPSASRIAGQRHLLRSLRSLQRRLERFTAYRARTDSELRWAGRFADALEAAFKAGIRDQDACASL